MENNENQNAETTNLRSVPPTSKMSKAFIGYVVVALVIVIAALALIFGRGDKGDVVVDNGTSLATSTSNGTIATTTATSSDPGPNDSNGSGQNEPSKPTPSTGYQSPISLPLYQNHIVGGESISQKVQIYAWAVLEDSRCPVDVQCIQAGRVRVGVRFINPETKKELIAGQVMEVDQKVKVNGLEITLLEVKPVTRSTVKIQDGDYKFIFGIAKIK